MTGSFLRRAGNDAHVFQLFELLKESAEKGNPVAQFELALCYDNGSGCEQNLQTSFEWYKKSAEQGYIYAQYELGCCYKVGDGCEENFELAFEWFKTSAEAGHEAAIYELASCYKCGRGCEKNQVEALRWCKRACFNNEEPKYSKILNLEDPMETHYYIDQLVERVETLEQTIVIQEGELKSAKRKIDELEITVPLEGGPEYQEAKRRFDEHKKRKL